MTENTGEQTGPGQAGAKKAGGSAEWFFGRVGAAMDEAANAFRPPEKAGEHFRQARVEFLKGLRELLNHRIERLSRNPRGGTAVVVE